VIEFAAGVLGGLGVALLYTLVAGLLRTRAAELGRIDRRVSATEAKSVDACFAHKDLVRMVRDIAANVHAIDRDVSGLCSRSGQRRYDKNGKPSEVPE